MYRSLSGKSTGLKILDAIVRIGRGVLHVFWLIFFAKTRCTLLRGESHISLPHKFLRHKKVCSGCVASSQVLCD